MYLTINIMQFVKKVLQIKCYFIFMYTTLFMYEAVVIIIAIVVVSVTPHEQTEKERKSTRQHLFAEDVD